MWPRYYYNANTAAYTLHCVRNVRLQSSVTSYYVIISYPRFQKYTKDWLTIMLRNSKNILMAKYVMSLHNGILQSTWLSSSGLYLLDEQGSPCFHFTFKIMAKIPLKYNAEQCVIFRPYFIFHNVFVAVRELWNMWQLSLVVTIYLC